MMTTLVLYHDDIDGFTSAWAFHRNRKRQNFNCIPVNYGTLLPEYNFPEADRLYIVDFSFSPEDMDILCSDYPIVFVIDHHKTACQKLADYKHPNCTLVLDTSHAGAVLTWRAVNPGETVPPICRYVEDRDLWKFELPESEAVNLYLATIPQDFGAWDVANAELTFRFADIVRQGHMLLRYRAQLVDTMCNVATYRAEQFLDVGAVTIASVNTSILQSEVGHAILDGNEKVDVVDLWCVDGNKGTLHSLRSRKNGVDVSEIAKKWGGGGHPAAAGFYTDTRNIPEGRLNK